MYPGDIVVCLTPEKLKTGDIIQIIFTDEKDEKLNIVHGKISSFNTDGSVEVEDLTSGEKYIVGKWNILGKLIRTVSLLLTNVNLSFCKTLIILHYRRYIS